ncbi:unnamed protein product [Paramecium pentaurelia]|uniref:CCHC-type domain-containing protein n=1 Tax=Paramecium pentaurelia TaxID=43138 RepID=A0A8S1V5K6_9CILI|nr:unnamed protein product [Paramecium pentaurelia]
MRKQITKNSQKQSKQSGVNKKIVKEPKQEANLRILHMTEEQYQEKISNLESRIAELQGPDNQTKRKRLYHELAQLKKNVKLIDPNVIEEKKQKDLERRIQKKLTKKQQVVEEIQKEKKQIKMKEKDKVCLVCKKIGHTAQHCRDNVQPTTDVICYNCGSQKHTLKDCQKPKSGSLKFATCFVCKETGHISRDCPKNPKGLYAYGGGCYICSSTHHTQANCPQNPKNRIISQQQQKQQDDFMSD